MRIKTRCHETSTEQGADLCQACKRHQQRQHEELMQMAREHGGAEGDRQYRDQQF